MCLVQLLIYSAANKSLQKCFLLNSSIFLFLVHPICPSVFASPCATPISAVRVSADPSCGFFCREDAKYQSLPTGAVMAKYTPVCEQDSIYPVSRMCECMHEHSMRACACPHAPEYAHKPCFNPRSDCLSSHLCARAYFLPLTISPLSVSVIFMRKGNNPLLSLESRC